MSKTWRTILILVAVLVVLGGALTFLLLSGDPEEDPADNTDSTGDTADETVPLIQIEAEKEGTVSPVRTAEIHSKEYGSFTVMQAEDGTLMVKGFDGLAPETGRFNSLETFLTDLTASKKIAETDTPAAYGFDDPQATFAVTYENGETLSFEFGDEEPYGTGDYFRFAGSNTVYLVSTSELDGIALNPNTYISTSLYSAPALPEAEGDESVDAVLRDIDLSGSFYGDESFAIRLINNEDSGEYIYTNYLITKPFVRSSNSDKLGESLVTSAALTADDVVVARYTQKDLETYGLTKPYVKAKLHTAARIAVPETDDEGNVVNQISYQNVEEHTVTFSKPDENGYHYVIVDDNPSLFRIGGSGISWLGLTYSDSVSSLLFLRNIETVSEMIFTISGEKTTFALTHHPEEEEVDDQLTVTANGKPVDDSEFRDLYQVAMGISRTGTTDKKVSGEPEVRIQVKGNGTSELDIKFYNAGASVYLVENRGEIYEVTASQIRDLSKQLNNLLEGKDVNVGY